MTVLGLVLLVFGAAYGSLNVAMNSAAVDLIAALRCAVMPGFHAAFSLGGMLGAGLGALIAGRLSPTAHLSLLAVIGLLVTAVAGRSLRRHPAPVSPERLPATEQATATAGMLLGPPAIGFLAEAGTLPTALTTVALLAAVAAVAAGIAYATRGAHNTGRRTDPPGPAVSAGWQTREHGDH